MGKIFLEEMKFVLNFDRWGWGFKLVESWGRGNITRGENLHKILIWKNITSF